jgi:hypothetical protein
MRKFLSSAAAAIALLATAFVSAPANAIAISTPAGLRGAIEDVAVTDKVHCVPGWLHHHWTLYGPTWNGCYRYRTGLLWAPPLFFRHRFHRHHHIHVAPHFATGHRFVGTTRSVSGARFGGARFSGGGRRGH